MAFLDEISARSSKQIRSPEIKPEELQQKINDAAGVIADRAKDLLQGREDLDPESIWNDAESRRDLQMHMGEALRFADLTSEQEDRVWAAAPARLKNSLS